MPTGAAVFKSRGSAKLLWLEAPPLSRLRRPGALGLQPGARRGEVCACKKRPGQPGRDWRCEQRAEGQRGEAAEGGGRPLKT